MGAIHQSPWADLARELAKDGGLEAFVETGTFLGYAMPWASRTFRKVWTIEINAKYVEQAQIANRSLGNVTFVHGDSASALPGIVKQLDCPTLFWLDAHAGGGSYGSEDNCPLAQELETIFSSPFEHCVLIDDARAFLAPPPPPFNYRKWPTLEDIFAVVLKRGGYNVVTINDVLIIVPEKLRGLVAEFCFALRPTI